MSYQQVIASKVKLNGIMGMQHHLLDRDRVKTNPDIDLTRSRFNYFIEGLTAENLNSRVKARIKQLNLKKRPRSDAVGLEDIVIKASPDFMLNVDAEVREKYFSDALHFLQNRYGKENVMYCQCHLDESSPHIHVGIVPITPDGRLSAKSLFSPKTLEQLQTDFHRDVSSRYGLERGESHAKKYLPIQKFKANQAKLKAEQFSHDLQLADIDRKKLEQIKQSTHYVKNGFLFTSEDKENVQLPTQNFIALRNIAEQGVKAVAKIDILKDDIQKIKHNEAQARSDLSFFLHELNKLEKDTANYSDVPKFCVNISTTPSTFGKKLLPITATTLIALPSKFLSLPTSTSIKLKKIMRNNIKKTGVKNIQKYIKNVVLAAHLQLKKNSQPTGCGCSTSWEPPKPSDTDFKKPDQTGLVLPPTPAHLGGEGINWDMVNWDLLTDLDKEEILRKLELARWL